MIKSITHFLIIFFIFMQLKSQISQIDQNGVNPFCDETLHIFAKHRGGGGRGLKKKYAYLSHSSGGGGVT